MSVPHSIPKKKRFANLLPVYPAFLKESLAKNFLQSFALPLARRQGMSRKNFAPRLQTFLAPLYQAAFVQRGCHPSSDQVGACVPETRRTVRPGFARRTKLSKEAGGRSPVTGGLGGEAYEHWRKPSAHRTRPPAVLWFLSDRSERNPPRRAEPSP